MYSIIFMIDVIGTIDFSNAQTIKAYKTYPTTADEWEKQIDILCTEDGCYIKYQNTIYEVVDEDDNLIEDYGIDNPLCLDTAVRPIKRYYDDVEKDNNVVRTLFKNGIQTNKNNVKKNLDVINEEDENLNHSF